MRGGDFAGMLKQQRQLAGLTQAELAQRSGVSAAAIRDLEQARSRRPRLRSIGALANALRLNGEQAQAFHHMALAAFDARDEPATTGETAITILGNLAVHRGEKPVALGAGRHRVVLARLALSPNTAVHRDELVDLLWPDNAPPSAINSVHSYISKLRRLFSPRPTIRRLPGGYRLNVDAVGLDLLRFRQWCAEAPELPAAAAFDRLAQALALWQGPPLHDVAELRQHPLVVGLAEEQVAAALELARLAGELARHRQVLPVLRALALAHPLDEPLHAALITGLAATGRQAAALAAYDELRRRLAGELGVDPGQHLQDVHRGVLEHRWPWAASPQPAAVAMYQTPAAPADFVGRDAQLRLLIRALGADPQAPLPHQVAVAAVCGAAGIGKTSLALRAAHLLRESFPDGQLYIDLQGASPRPVTPAEALAQFLRALGGDNTSIPAGEAECAARFRSELAGRRMLVVLDNARDAAQIRPLLPGAGGSAALVTCRRRLTALAGATIVDLGLFSPAESLSLLAEVTGVGRVEAERAAAAELTGLCGHLPIALRVAGGRLASRPNWTIASFAGRLRDHRRRLDELRAGDLAVDASFRCSYADLSPAAAAAFRKLALLPAGRFSLGAAAALLGRDPGEAEQLLDHLVDANLLQAHHDASYSLHDLLLLYATRRAESEDPPPARDAAFGRLLTWCLAHCVAAMRWIYPDMVRLPTETPQPRKARAIQASMADRDEALSWLDSHIKLIVTVTGRAQRHGHPARAWQLADQLRGYFLTRRNTTDWITTGHNGLAAAQAAQDITAQAAMHQTLGQAHWALGRHEQALAHYQQAAVLADQGGWIAGAAYLRHNIGLVQHQLGRLSQAHESFRHALDLSREHGLTHTHAVTLNDLGVMDSDQGRLTEAVAHFTEALRLNQGESRRGPAAANHNNLGMVLRQLGHYAAAREHLNAALDWYRQIGSEHGELSVLDELSQLYTLQGEHSFAVVAAKQAVELARLSGDKMAESALLCTLGEAVLGAGDIAPAREAFAEAEKLATAHSYPHYRARARTGAAAASLAEGHPGQAIDIGQAALESARSRGYRPIELAALTVLTRAHLARGDRGSGLRLCRQALSIAQTTGAATAAAQLRKLMTQVGHTGPSPGR